MLGVYERIHLPAYTITALAALGVIYMASPLARLITGLVTVGVIANIELWAVSRQESFDPNPIVLSLILLIYTLIGYAGIDRPYIIQLAMATAAVLIAASYWETGEEYTRPYTPLLPITLFTAPIAGILSGGEHPFLLTIVSMLETSIVYGINTWPANEYSKLLGHAAMATVIYGLVYAITGETLFTMFAAATYFIKHLASEWDKPSSLYPSIDPYVKTILEGVTG